MKMTSSTLKALGYFANRLVALRNESNPMIVMIRLTRLEGFVSGLFWADAIDAQGFDRLNALIDNAAVWALHDITGQAVPQ